MQRIVWVQLDEGEVFHAIPQKAAYDMDADFETLCEKVGWFWLSDESEGVEDFKQCPTCKEIWREQ
jgi:hypothetical protein